MPLAKLRVFESLVNIGCVNLALPELAATVAYYGRQILMRADIIAALFTLSVMFRHKHAGKAFEFVTNLAAYGKNLIATDCYFATLALAHSFSVNRHQFSKAISLERQMRLALQLKRNVVQIA